MLAPVDRRGAAALAWLEPHADAMAELVMELVALDTENPPGRGLRGCAVVSATRWTSSAARLGSSRSLAMQSSRIRAS
jgi:hypothetical protein